jgi:nucleotidyltransferase-like protein
MRKPVRPSPIKAALDVRRERFGDAEVIFLAGSVPRGEGTPYSDLDIVVICKKLPAAYRQSFVHQGWPVEAFVHDPETLNYFFWERDRPSGVPSLATMVKEGKAIPKENQLSRSLRALAQAVIKAGPPEWTEPDIARARYAITDLCDDIRAPRNHAELVASASRLYELLADFYFRSMGGWSAKSKTLPRKLAEADPALAQRFIKAFDATFSTHNSSPILQLSQQILGPHGGFLFDNYRLDAPPAWRKPLPKKRHR